MVGPARPDRRFEVQARTKAQAGLPRQGSPAGRSAPGRHALGGGARARGGV